MFVQNNVFWLKITVKDLVFMKSLNAQQYLASIVPNVLFFKFFAFLEEFRKVTALAIVHDKK